MCNVPETVFDYDRYTEERDELEESVENILAREVKNIGIISTLINFLGN